MTHDNDNTQQPPIEPGGPVVPSSTAPPGGTGGVDAPGGTGPGGPGSRNRWWILAVVLLAAVVVVGLVINGMRADDPSDPPVEPGPTEDADDGPPDEEPPPDEGENGEATTPPDDGDQNGQDALPDPQDDPTAYFEALYGTFEPIELEGSGDGVVDLREGSAAGVMTFTHDGDGLVRVIAVDEAGERAGQFVAASGAYEGTTVFGTSALGEPRRIQVLTDGDWTMEIVPVAQAPMLERPAEGSGDAVYLHVGDADTWQVTHDGEGAFILTVYTEGPSEPLLVQAGEVEAEVGAPGQAGVVAVVASGAWTIE